MYRLNDEKWSSLKTLLNSCWLSCCMPSVDLFMFLGCFSSQIYWILRVIMILSVWGNNHGCLEGFDIKRWRIKVKTPVCRALGHRTSNSPIWQFLFAGPWGATLARAPCLASEICGLVPHASQRSKDASSSHSFPIFSY